MNYNYKDLDDSEILEKLEESRRTSLDGRKVYSKKKYIAKQIAMLSLVGMLTAGFCHGLFSYGDKVMTGNDKQVASEEKSVWDSIKDLLPKDEVIVLADRLGGLVNKKKVVDNVLVKDERSLLRACRVDGVNGYYYKHDDLADLIISIPDEKVKGLAVQVTIYEMKKNGDLHNVINTVDGRPIQNMDTILWRAYGFHNLDEYLKYIGKTEEEFIADLSKPENIKKYNEDLDRYEENLKAGMKQGGTLQ